MNMAPDDTVVDNVLSVPGVVLPEARSPEPISSKIGGGASCGEACPNTMETANGKQRAHTRIQPLTRSQTVLSVPGAISQWQ
jgi:hypothetical protein